MSIEVLYKKMYGYRIKIAVDGSDNGVGLAVEECDDGKLWMSITHRRICVSWCSIFTRTATGAPARNFIAGGINRPQRGQITQHRGLPLCSWNTHHIKPTPLFRYEKWLKDCRVTTIYKFFRIFALKNMINQKQNEYGEIWIDGATVCDRCIGAGD